MIKRFIAFIILIYAIGFAWFALALPQPADDPRADAVVVLTGGANRIDRALSLLEDKKVEKMLISGVDRDVKPKELAAEYNRPAEIFECCIDLGFRSVDTRSNALETARWVARHDVNSLLLVTHDWHMRRARLELDNALDSNIVIINDAVKTSPSLNILFKEYNKYILRQIVAWIGI